MKKKWFISKDTDYYRDNEDAIELENCPAGGDLCKSQMAFMNKNLISARKLIENKEYTRAVISIKDSFDSTFELKEKQCQACADLFRKTISNKLDQLILDLDEMTNGFMGIKSYQSDLNVAKRLLQDMKDRSNSTDGNSD